MIVTELVTEEVHPEAFVTVNMYVFDVSPLKVPVVPVPLGAGKITGFELIVHVPAAGNPLNATLPVATVQVGWVTVPTTGTLGVGG